MRIGIVCPYSLDVPGGVQNHIKDLAEALIARGHYVSVLAPSEDDELPAYVVGAGRAVAVSYNGSVARMAFGPVVAAKVRRWVREGHFDVLHLHEPHIPSLSLIALWAADCPVVATFHSSNVRSRAMSATASILRPSFEKINARIAVSEYARDTLVNHVGGEPVVIPNGLYVDRFSSAEPREEWRGADGTVVFVGRLDEPRKGFPVIAEGFGRVAAGRPGLRLLVVAAALRTADVYVAPNTGGESFGIVLIEGMAAGATVLASDIPAFRRVLADGAAGALFRSEDVDDLVEQLTSLLDDPQRRTALDAAAASAVRRYDWSAVAGQVEQVYETIAVDSGTAGGAR